MSLTENVGFQSMFQRNGVRASEDPSGENATVGPQTLPNPSLPEHLLSADQPPVSARPSEGSRPERIRDENQADSDGAVPPPVEPTPPVRRLTLSERWLANRDWLVPFLWGGFVVVLFALVLLTDYAFRPAAVLAAVVFVVTRIFRGYRRSVRITRKEAEAKRRTSVGNRVIVILSNSGGAAKSTLTALLATALKVSGKQRAVLDFNNNSGDVGRKLNIMKGFTARIRSIYNHMKDQTELNTIFRQLHVNDDGVVLIDSERNQKSADELPEDEVPMVIDAVAGYFPTVLVDNGTNNTGRYEMASARRGDVALFVGQTGKPATVRAIPETIAAYEQNGIEDIKSRAIVVVSRPRRFFSRNRNQLIGLDPSIPVLTIPWDPWLMTDSAIRYSLLFRRTKEAMLDLILASCDIVPKEHERLSPQIEVEDWINARLAELNVFPPPQLDTPDNNQPSTDHTPRSNP